MEGTLYHPYQNLRVYQYASALASDLFWTTHRFPMEDPFRLTHQLRQTARTISLNVVQGWNKRYNGPACRNHLDEAQAACARLGLWLDVSHESCYLTDTEHEDLHARKSNLQRMLTRLHDHRIAMLA